MLDETAYELFVIDLSSQPHKINCLARANLWKDDQTSSIFVAAADNARVKA